MTQDDIFSSLTLNAFDFLGRGIEEFDKAPKYSVIHFCAAVEMLLKARLMKEHWSLIVSRPDQAKLHSFIAGDFTSVTMNEARARIQEIAGDSISDEAFSSFRNLANHRNKMIHFFHADVDSNDQAKEQIVAEHCRSWFHLHRLLNRWGTYFRDYRHEISRADHSMKQHRKYLINKFNALAPELANAREHNAKPELCGACGFGSAIPEAFDDQIAYLSCLVCDHKWLQVDIDCPSCGQPIAIVNQGFAGCGHCGVAVEPHHLVDALTDHAVAYMAMKDGDDGFAPANCGDCDGYHTVVRRGDRYF
jgi:hypothetical protein